MSSAGQRLVAGRVPGERIATATEAADSSGITTTETAIATVVAPVVAGRTYGIGLMMYVGTDTAGQSVLIKVRSGSTVGTEIGGAQFKTASDSAVGDPVKLEWEHTAAATGDLTLVATLVRNGGAGTVRREAASTRPLILSVNYLTG